VAGLTGKMMNMVQKTKFANQSDEEIMKRLANGDTAAIGLLYKKYGDTVLRFVGSLLDEKDSSYARDLSHDIFLTILNSAPNYKEEGKLKSWIIGIAAKKTKSWRKKNWLRGILMQKYINQIKTDNETNKVLISYDSKVKPENIKRILSTLSPAQYEVMILYVFEQMTGKEIAEALGINEEAVWSRLKRAKTVLKKIIGDKNTVNEVLA
jgi:RNA polymerase sigma-70 factor (ECF subfamily)